MWNKEKIPSSWAEALICPIHKKGDVQNCENSRGISLVNAVYRVLSIVLYRRLKPHADKKYSNTNVDLEECQQLTKYKH
jgi:hypothetical protein